MTYTELKTQIADFLNRDDLTSAIPGFIALAEAGINRQLRLQRMVKRAIATADEGYITLPSDWLESVNVQTNVNGLPRKLQYMTLEQADDFLQKRGIVSGLPEFFNVTGTQLELVPRPESPVEIELTYFAKIPALSDSSPSNFLFLISPDLYLYGALIHSAPYLKEDGRVSVWASLYEKAVQEIALSDEKSRFSGSALIARAQSFG